MTHYRIDSLVNNKGVKRNEKKTTTATKPYPPHIKNNKQSGVHTKHISKH